MEQVRAKIDVLHRDAIHKAGHIFKIPDDMDLETAKRLVAKDICTDCIEVLEEPAGETTITLGDEAGAAGDIKIDLELGDDLGEGEAGEEVTEPGDAPEDDGGETDDDSCATDTCDMHSDGMCGDEDGPHGCENRTRADVEDISQLTKKELKPRLKARGLSTAGNKDEMHDRLVAAIEAENADGTDDSEDAGEGDSGEG